MRIALYNIEEKNDIIKTIDSRFQKSIFKDSFLTNFEDFSYCTDTRVYDMIFIKYEDFICNKYFNVFKYTMNNNNNTKIFLYMDNSENHTRVESFIETIKTCYIGLDVTIININKDEMEENISKSISSYFSDFMSMPFIESIDNKSSNDKMLRMNLDGGTIDISTDKDIDFNILIFFIKNYEKILTLKSIASAIADVPENTPDSKLENSISKIRKKLIEFNENINIQTFKKNGYKMVLN